MRSEEFVFTITSLAVAIAEDHTDDEILLLSAMFMQLGDTLATLSAKNNMCKNTAVLE